MFDGLNDAADPDFVSCDLPTDPGDVQRDDPGAGRGRLLPAADRVRRDREHVRQPRRARTPRQNLLGFGNAFAGRGMSLNDAIESPQPALREPAPRRAASSPTRRPSFAASSPSWATRRGSSPRSPTSRPSSSPTRRSRSRRSRPTPRRSRRRSPRARRRCGRRSTRSRASAPFLAELAELSSRLRPGVDQLRLALPSLNSAVEVGTPVLGATPDLNRDLRATLASSRRLIDQPETKLAFVSASTRRSTRRSRCCDWVVPAQTVCNYFNYWFTFLPVRLRPRPGRLQLPPGPDAGAARPH